MQSTRHLWLLVPALFFMHGLAEAVPLTPADEAELRLADDVAKSVESLRGWKFKQTVKKGMYSEAELRAFIEKRLAEEYPPAELESNEEFLRTIGALPESTSLRQTLIDVLMSQIGGFYDPPSKTFYMVKREGTEYGQLVDRILIAHELTHALDDQHVSLDSLMSARDRSQDGEFVIGALVEGSATEVMTRYVTQAQFSGDLKADELQTLMKSEEERSRVFFEAPRYFQSLLANYTCGMFFLLQGQLGALLGGSGNTINAGENFLKAVHDPPRSSEQILHPDKYWNAETRDEPVLLDEGSASRVFKSAGYRVVSENTAGEILAAILTTPADLKLDPMAAGLPTYWTNTAAEGWGGDRFYLLDSGKGPSRAVWITTWDTADDRDEFETTYTSVFGKPLTRAPIGTRGVAFLYGFSSDQSSMLAKELSQGALRFTHAGKPWDPKG
ncbi:MAG TPA: hypothetical protein VE910_04485 [Dongiaceae bacterium]|nr:hypothetical protein [Dongiaceae bacterium]